MCLYHLTLFMLICLVDVPVRVRVAVHPSDQNMEQSFLLRCVSLVHGLSTCRNQVPIRVSPLAINQSNAPCSSDVAAT